MEPDRTKIYLYLLGGFRARSYRYKHASCDWKGYSNCVINEQEKSPMTQYEKIPSINRTIYWSSAKENEDNWSYRGWTKQYLSYWHKWKHIFPRNVAECFLPEIFVAVFCVQPFFLTRYLMSTKNRPSHFQCIGTEISADCVVAFLDQIFAQYTRN